MENGVFAFNNADFVVDFHYRVEKKRQETGQSAKKHCKILIGIIAKIKAAQEKTGHKNNNHHFSKFNLKECGAYLQYKCHWDDNTMPKEVVECRV